VTAAPSITGTIAQSMMTALEAAIDAGTAAVIEIYSGTTPADADASGAGLTLLARLTCAVTFGTVSGSGTNAIITAAAITGATAVATGTATTVRILTQTGGTVCFQGNVATTAADLILNTVAVTTGSTVNITSCVLTLPRE
jgi:hypothetical protein